MPAYRHREQHRLHTLRFGPRHFYWHHVKRETHPHRSRAATSTRHRKQLLLALGGLTILVVALVLLGFSAYHSALRAKQSLESARTVISSDLSNKQLFVSATGRAKLAVDIQTVQADAIKASSELNGSPGIRVLGYVPFLSDQSNGIVSLVNDVRTTADTGSVLLHDVNELVSQSNGTNVSLTALQALHRSVLDRRPRSHNWTGRQEISSVLLGRPARSSTNRLRRLTTT